MDTFLREIGEYLNRGYNIDKITNKIIKSMKKQDIIEKMFPSEIVKLIRSFIHDPHLILATGMLFRDQLSYPMFNTEEDNNKILETLSRLLVNNSVTVNDVMINRFFCDYITLQIRDINTTEKILENYRDILYFDQCFDFSGIITLEERQLFEKYRNMLTYCYSYKGKFPWERQALTLHNSISHL